MGSPGAGEGVSTADGYPHLPADHTYVIAFDQDPVTQTRTDLAATAASTLLAGPRISGADGEPFGVDPALANFGAQVVDATTNVPEVRMSLSLPGPIEVLADPVESAVVNQWLALLPPFGDQLPVRPIEGGSGRGGHRPLHRRTDQAWSMTPRGPRPRIAEHDDQVRIDNPNDIRDYYAAVADALIPHLAGRPVTVGTADGSLLGVERIDTRRRLGLSARTGCGHPGDGTARSAARTGDRRLPGRSPGARCTSRAGEGTGIATAATAALALCQAMTSDGLTAVVTTDGGEGLYVRAMGPRTRRRPAGATGHRRRTLPEPGWTVPGGRLRGAEELARNAPEIATATPGRPTAEP